MNIETGLTFGARLCEALGVDKGRRIKSINMFVSAEKVVELTIVEFLSAEASGRLLELLTEYEMVEKRPVTEFMSAEGH